MLVSSSDQCYSPIPNLIQQRKSGQPRRTTPRLEHQTAVRKHRQKRTAVAWHVGPAAIFLRKLLQTADYRLKKSDCLQSGHVPACTGTYDTYVSCSPRWCQFVRKYNQRFGINMKSQTLLIFTDTKKVVSHTTLNGNIRAVHV